MVEDSIVRRAIRAERTVLVSPAARHWWRVAVQGGPKPQQFIDRRLAVNYAKVWAEANRPSRVQLLAAGERVEREWRFA